MAKDKLTDYDSTASNNLDVGGISIAEGMLPSNVNNAIREQMSHLADAFGAGTPMYVDQINNYVGIGNAAPAAKLHVNSGTADLAGLFESSDANATITLIDNSTTGGSAAEHGLNTVGDQLEIRAVDNLSFETAATERMNIDVSGNVGIATSSPSDVLEVAGNIRLTDGAPTLRFAETDGTADENYQMRMLNGSLMFQTNNDAFSSSSTKFYMDQGGRFLVGTDDAAPAANNVQGHVIKPDARCEFSVDGGTVVYINRVQDGSLVSLRSAGNGEGSISVSGTTVSYNGGHLARWSRLIDNSKDTSIVKGTVMTNLNEMVEWGDEDNEQLNKMAVSSVEGDANVAGVFVNWDEDDDWNDMNVAMTGDMVIRIAQGTTVAQGDLLMSAGDGTAKPQGDDIVRSKTIAKVISTHVSHTYDDGSYLVPCVLMAC